MSGGTTNGSLRLPRKVLIANRGEIAVRIARTCRSMGIATVAVFSDVDAGALHVAVCDEAVRLGGAAPGESYLRGEAVIAAARRTGADAIHPGYGFLAENAAFARDVQEAGLTWIGPTPEAIAAMGDKLEAKRRMAAAGVPLVPGEKLPDGELDDDRLHALAVDVGYPLMVKAAAGGGGKGMRVVAEPGDLLDAVAAARREATAAFGDGTVFLERCVARPRHVEVQVLGDATGTVVHCFERECSIQRRHQKVVEEAPSPGIDDEVRAALCEAAVDAASTIGYVGAGTVEFIADEGLLAARRAGASVDPRDCFAFLEVNTRLQVEHPVTEETVRVRDRTTGALGSLDLVRCQLLVAAGAPLPFAQDDLVQAGHAIEVRLYAEDPAAGYLPATGTLTGFVPATGPGVRWDTGVVEGDTISVHYDPMIAKVIAAGPTRAEAAGQLARALDDTVLMGATTNRDLLVAVLRDDAFLDGDTTTGFLAERFPSGDDLRFAPNAAAVTAALAAAVVAEVRRHRRDAESASLPVVPPGFTNAGAFDPEVVHDVGEETHRVRYRCRRDGTIEVHRFDGDGGRTGEPLLVGDHGGSGTTIDLEIDGHRQRVTFDTRGPAHGVHTPAGRVVLHRQPRFPDAVAEQVAGATLAPMPGTVVAVVVTDGDTVDAGALLCTVEAMKMEHRVNAPVAGTVAEVRVTPGDQVDADQILVVVAPHDDPTGAS